MPTRTSTVVTAAAFCLALVVLPVAISPATGAVTAVEQRSQDTAEPVRTILSDQQDGQTEFIQPCADDPPADFADPATENHTLGWTEGYWYNEPLQINITGGLNQSELERLSARTAARFEVMRCLDATEGTPSVEIISRQNFTERQEGVFSGVGNKTRLADNAKFETMLLIGSESNSTDVREQNRASTISGSYNFRTDTITIVSDNPESLLIDEKVLVHEIGHAVQDQHFNLSAYNRQTLDRDRGILSLIEGDVSYIEQRYLDACKNGRWKQPCVTEDFGTNSSNSSQSNAPSNWGLYFSQYQPYSDGPSLVKSAYERGGWEAVNKLYEDPPTSAYYSAFPGSYGTVELTNVTVPDTSTEEWERLTFENTTNYDTIGVAGISAMFIAPTYESQGRTQIYNPQNFLNTAPGGGVDSFDPLNYNQPQTEGWRDDKLYTYRNETGETGVVWKIDWAAPEDTELFVESYQKLIRYRGGKRVEGYKYTYTFGEDTRFDIAITIVPSGDTVSIVTGPTVESLTKIHQNITLQKATDTDSGDETDGNDSSSQQSTPEENDTDDGNTQSNDGETTNTTPQNTDQQTQSSRTDTPEDGAAGNDSNAGSSSPGFGAVAALVALLGAGLLAQRRR